jgi:formyltetrahydrofolate deformylase
MENHVLTIETSDEKGLVHRVTGCLLDHDLNLVSNGEFVEPETGLFFMRTEMEGKVAREALLSDLDAALPPASRIRLEAPRKKQIVVLATREAHCLGDILVRCQFDEMNAELLAVISNHERLRGLVENAGFHFHYISHKDLSREAHEEAVIEQIETYSPDYLVLAKYMRILTPNLVRRFPNRIVNIHHSFLPAFVGANPYRQAFERGVKIIGATAHFVTDELDEGPIIAQSVFPVGHQYSATQLAMAGHNVEKFVLSRALHLVLDDRVFISGNKTIIFE